MSQILQLQKNALIVYVGVWQKYALKDGPFLVKFLKFLSLLLMRDLGAQENKFGGVSLSG